MPIRFRDRLSYKQARTTVLIAFLLGLLLGLFQVLSDYQAQDRQIDESIETYIAITRTPAARIAYNIDKELAYELVLGLIESPTIIHAEMVDPSGNPLAVVSMPAQNDRGRSFTDMLFGASRTYIRELRVPYDPEEKLGWLKIVADTRPMGAQFLDRALITLGTGLVRTMLLSLLLLTTFYLMLTKPLLTLTDRMVANPDRDDDLHIPEPKGHEHDEIGLLARTINHYLDNIHHHLHHRTLAEEQLREHLAQLETIIARRTHEIRRNNEALEQTNHKLELARREALDRARQRTNQLSSLSHEIRTPLNGLLGMLNITLADDLPEQQRKRLVIARDSGSHLVSLLNDILDLSKLESGKMQMEQIPFDLRRTVEEVVMLTSPSAFARGVPIFCDIDPVLPEQVIGDPTRFHQVVSNLISNAVKFTDQGDIRLTVDTHSLTETRTVKSLLVRLQISDTGIGIPESALEEVFKPFGQASTDTSRKFGGSGMGLPLAQSIVNSMDGKLSVSSSPGEGSTFTVELPFEVQEPATGPSLEISEQQLLLHCREPLQDACSRLLTHWGCKHRLGDSSTRLEENWADLLITDSPDLATRAAQATSSLKVILMNYVQPNEAPANVSWMPLPLSRDLFSQTLQKTLELNETSTTPENIETAPVIVQQPFKVLVVEDNPVNRMVAEGMLEHLGYTVAIAQNGEDCLNACQATRFDLILMDCNMPVLDGFSTTRLLREKEATRDIPIIALTANALNEHRESCLDAGMNDHIAKPFNKDELGKTLSHWLESA